MSDGATESERRQAPRFSCVGEAEIVVPGRGLRYAGRIGDLSAGGCFIETKCRLERGTSVEVWLSTEGLPLRLAANLVVRREGGVGCRFHSVSPRKVEQIRQVIAELAAARAKDKDEPEPEAAGPMEAAAVVLQAPVVQEMRRGVRAWISRWLFRGRLCR